MTARKHFYNVNKMSNWHHMNQFFMRQVFYDSPVKKLTIAYPLQLQASGEAQGEPGSVPSCPGNKGIQTLLWTGWSCIYTAFKSWGRSRLCLLHNNNKHCWMRTVWRIKNRTIYTSHLAFTTSCKFGVDFWHRTDKIILYHIVCSCACFFIFLGL